MSPEELRIVIAATRLNECLMFDPAAVEAMDDLTKVALISMQDAIMRVVYSIPEIHLPDIDGLAGQRAAEWRRGPTAEADPFSSEAQAAMGRHPSSGEPTMQQMSRDQGSAGSVPAGLGPGVPWPPPGQHHASGRAADLVPPPTAGRTEEDG